MIGGVFGVLGGGSGEAAHAMGAAMAHRGARVLVRPVGGAGWIGVVSDDPGSRLVEVEGDALACDARIYDSGDALARLSSALHAGAAAVEGVDGDYALARIDAASGRLTVARDYCGSRPMHLALCPGGGLAFASEIKALLALPGMPRRADRAMVQHLQHAKRLPMGRTLLEGVWAAPPGAVVDYLPDGTVAAEHRFAGPEPTGAVTDPGEACELIRERLEAAARRRTPGTEPIGLALSGGIDSIVLAFLFRRLHPGREILTFTAGSHAQDHECVTARRVAAAVGARHHEVLTPAAEMPARLAGLVRHLEDPCARSEAYQLYELARAASAAGVRVLHHGQAADALFAGMPRHGLLAMMQRRPLLRRALVDVYAQTQLGLPARSTVARLMLLAKQRGSVPPVPRVIGAGPPDRPALPEPGPQFINRAIARGLQAGVSSDAQKFERTFAAWGVEARTVNFDSALMRAAFSIDDALKIREGQQKWIFREAVKPWVPEAFRWIPKFPQRMEANLELAAALDGLADAILSPGAVGERGLFEPGDIRRLRRRRRSRAYSHEGGMRLWTAILTELWAREFLDGEPAAEPMLAGVAHG